jgi:hypothetical protein
LKNSPIPVFRHSTEKCRGSRRGDVDNCWPLLMPAFAGMTKNLGLQRVTSGQRKNSTFAARNQTVLGGAAEIGPLMPKTAS